MADGIDWAIVREYERYLLALPLDDDPEEPDMDVLPDHDGDTIRTPVRPLPRPQKVELKRPSRHEDAGWIAAQGQLLEAIAEAPAGDTESPVDGRGRASIFDCEIRGATLEECLSKLREREAKEEAARAVFWSPFLCMSRIWGGGWGGQCTHAKRPDSEYCTAHEQELRRQQYLTHGRIDGPIPPKKRKEYEKWQAILKDRESQQAGASFSPPATPGAAGSSPPSKRPRSDDGGCAAADAGEAANHGGACSRTDTPGSPDTMQDGADFDEASWRAMGRGASESLRAYYYRTGQRAEGDPGLRGRRLRAVRQPVPLPPRGDAAEPAAEPPPESELAAVDSSAAA